MQRNRAKKAAELPPVHTLVKAQMKEKRITQKKLARALGCTEPSVHYLLKSPDWKISELLTVGRVLNENLLNIYLPPADNTALAALQQELADTRQQLEAGNQIQQQQANEINLLNTRIEALREALSLIGGK